MDRNISIKRFEEISMNAWPALQTVLYDGWVLRFADGYTRRANSVNPIYASSIDLNIKIEYCEKSYARRGLRTIFKMTDDVCPSDLDRVLQDKGYIREAETSVQILRLNSINPNVHSDVEMDSTLDDSWLDAFVCMSGAAMQYKNTLRSMLEKCTQDMCIARVRDGGSIVACGLGVRDGKIVGLFDIIVDAQVRGRGLGRRITESILAWAIDSGAETSYLQVMVDNKNALALYHKMGFREIYRYWYRVTAPS